MTTTDKLAAFDAAIAAELPRVYHLEYDSHEICKHFAGKVRERLLAAHEESLRENAEQVEFVAFEDRNGALRDAPEKCQAFGAGGIPAAVWVFGVRFVPERAAPVEQAAQAVPADLYVGLIERLMKLSTRLGIAHDDSVEHFAASLEDRLYAICRSTESLLNSLARAAPAQRQPLTEWQPIETAPKDGTRLILSDGKFVGAGVWVGRYFAWGVSPEPTHWMPLPAAPQEPTHG